jgi:hypothetical protein
MAINPERTARIEQYNEVRDQLWHRTVQRLQQDERWDSKSLGFEFTTNDDVRLFGCPMTCMTCIGWKRNGQADCSRSTCKSLPMCHSHALAYFNVEVKDTGSFVGLGLFAKRRHRRTPRTLPLFLTGDLVCWYIGEKMTKAIVDARYPGDVTAPYAWEEITMAPPRPVFDSACMRGIGSFANSADERQVQLGPLARFTGVNAELIFSHHLGWPIIRALRPIYDGQEIVISYGDAYDYEDAKHSTRKRKMPETELYWPTQNQFVGFPNFAGDQFPPPGRGRGRGRGRRT